jgi:hypothetical protein
MLLASAYAEVDADGESFKLSLPHLSFEKYTDANKQGAVVCDL